MRYEDCDPTRARHVDTRRAEIMSGISTELGEMP